MNLERYILEGNEVIDTNIASPRIVVFTFSDAYTTEEKRRIVINLNYSVPVLSLVSSYKGNFHIQCLTTFLTKLYGLVENWEYNNCILSKKNAN